VVVATEEAREKVRYQVGFDMMIYESMAQRDPTTPAEHEQRVRLLTDAWDGLQWLEMN
jgi:hypothetical protein